jgi:hypothetical protein
MDRTLFLLGTLGLANENELHVLEHSDETDSISHIIFRHAHEIHSISSCPRPDAKYVIGTSYNVGRTSIRIFLSKFYDLKELHHYYSKEEQFSSSKLT